MANLAEDIPENPIDEEEEEEEKKHTFLRSVMNSVAGAALNLYAQVKDKTPENVKITIESVETKVGSVTAPIVEELVRLGDPALSWTDEKLDIAFVTLKAKTISFLNSPMAQQVNQNLILPSQAKAVAVKDAAKERIASASESAVHFHHVALEAFSNLKASGERNISQAQFVTGMRVKLGSLWNESLMPAAHDLYSRFTSTQTETDVPPAAAGAKTD